MGESRNEIARRREGLALRAANDRRPALAVSSRDQHDGIARANGDGAQAEQHRGSRPGNSAYSEGETADGSAGRVEPPQTRTQPAACAAEARQRGRVPGSGAPLRNRRWETGDRKVLARRPADPEMLAERWRAVRYSAECAHARSGNRSAQRGHVPDAGLRRPNDWYALASPQGWGAPWEALLRTRRADARGRLPRRRSGLHFRRYRALAGWAR